MYFVFDKAKHLSKTFWKRKISGVRAKIGKVCCIHGIALTTEHLAVRMVTVYIGDKGWT